MANCSLVFAKRHYWFGNSNTKSESGFADTRYWNVVPFRRCSYFGSIVLLHSSDITSKPKRYISENGGIVHEFFRIGKAFCIQKASKSLLLLLIVFAISTLLLAGVASKNASIEVQDKTRQAIGAGFLLERNAEYRTKRLREYSEKIGNKEGSFGGYHQKKVVVNGVENWQGWATNEFETLDIKDIEKMAKTKGIADYNITTAITAVNPVNFQRIEDKDVDQSVDEGGVSLIGNKDMKLDRNVLSGNLHIKEGRMITPEDKDMCVISEELAKQNNLKIGDKISFNDYHDTENSKVSEAEIVGIYQVDQKMSPLMQGDTYRSENVIFTDLRFPEKAEGETSPLYERAYFKVEDVEAYDEVKENLQNTDINWEQYDLIDNNGNSETMSSNFNDLAKVSEMMILVISVASFVILVLVFLFWLKNRVQEVGIFLSLGVPKFRIIGQIWSEAIMITVLSLMLSFAVAPAVSKVTANYLVSQQVQQMQEEEKNNEGKVSTEYVAPKQDVQSISVEVTPEMYLLDGVSVLVLITASVLVSGIVILKRNPKDILSEMS